MVADLLERVAERLDTRLVAHRRMRVGGARPRFGRVDPALAVHVEELLGARVVGLEHVVGERPGGRDAVGVDDLAEVLGAQPEQRPAVDLAVAADEIVQPGVEGLAAGAVPGLLRLILAVDEHRRRVPVLAFALEVGAALEDQDALARGGELQRRGASARTRADDDDVVVFGGHRRAPRGGPARNAVGVLALRQPTRARRERAREPR